ncbi:hypothetical protein D8T45_07710 [Vibrio vulnificus]|nr:hypothetical protein D8T45_07710 [Vibrio vulnificus]RZR05909.1 hypothetical protein D8T24_23970 [Vibrio vulnificus]
MINLQIWNYSKIIVGRMKWSIQLNRAICAKGKLTRRLRRTPNAWHFRFDSALVFTAQWFRCGGRRCSPLNAALCSFRDVIDETSNFRYQKIR